MLKKLFQEIEAIKPSGWLMQGQVPVPALVCGGVIPDSDRESHSIYTVYFMVGDPRFHGDDTLILFFYCERTVLAGKPRPYIFFLCDSVPLRLN